MASTYLESLRRFFGRVRDSTPVRFARTHKRPLAILVLVAFFVFVGVYIAVDPSIVARALSIGWSNVALLALLYCGIIATHFGILDSTIRLCGMRLGAREGLLLTIYSTVANFFGPLQSGPGVRAAYLKTRLGMRLRDFTAATLFYYAAFATLNVALLFVIVAPWVSALCVTALAAAVFFVVGRFLPGARLGPLIAITCFTAAQVVIMSTVFFVELNAVGSSPVPFTRALVYGGSANLSLFVSITPGGIGFREGFLLFAQGLHHVTPPTIATASIVDRAFYVLFLGALLVLSSVLNLRGMFGTKGEGEAPSNDGG